MVTRRNIAQFFAGRRRLCGLAAFNIIKDKTMLPLPGLDYPIS
jgi:hypothetical protein